METISDGDLNAHRAMMRGRLDSIIREFGIAVERVRGRYKLGEIAFPAADAAMLIAFEEHQEGLETLRTIVERTIEIHERSRTMLAPLVSQIRAALAVPFPQVTDDHFPTASETVDIILLHSPRVRRD